MSEENQGFRAFAAFAYVGLLSVFATITAARADAPVLPFDLEATNVADVLSNVHGGLARESRVLDKMDVTATFAGDDHGLPGWTGFVDLQATTAADFSGQVVGDLQGISNIDAPAGFRILDAWFAYGVEGTGGAKAGIIDLNSEFDVTQTAVLFLNPSHGIGPDFAQSGENGPSIFPNPGLGLVGYWMPGDHWLLKAGVFEGTSGDPAHPGRESIALTGREGALFAVEARYRPQPNWVLSLGGWAYTAAFDTLAGGHGHGNAGLYAMTEGKLITVEGHDEQGLDGWLRVGFANSAINPVAAYVGGGVVYTGLFDDADQAGLALAAARIGDAAKVNLGLGDGETTLEATYAYAVFDWLTVQPDFQYVISPGADPTLDDAFVIGSRISLTWN